MFGGSDFYLGFFPFFGPVALGSAKLVSRDWFECLIQASLFRLLSFVVWIGKALRYLFGIPGSS